MGNPIKTVKGGERMTYKDQITNSMQWLAEQKDTVFIGEGLINAGRIYGTMTKVPTKKCIEMPIAENLIVGAAIGLAIEGYRPIVVFQRMDFMLVAADAIINHLALIPKMSGDRIKLPVILRAIIGNQDLGFDVGLQHKADYTNIFEPYIHTVPFTCPEDVTFHYKSASKVTYPVLFIERYNDYEKTK